MLRSTLVAVLVVLAVPAQAEIYRYRDPETGQTKITNIPPPAPKAAPKGGPAQPDGTRPGAAPAAAGPVRERRFPVGERGFIVLAVPAGWVDEVQPAQPPVPPTIVLRPASGPVFEVHVTPIAPARPDAPTPSADAIRQYVRGAAEKLGSQAVERDIPLRTLTGPQSSGAYVSVTDRAPKPGEYRYMTHGMIGLAELRATFSVFTNDGQERVVPQALEMLRTARREAGEKRVERALRHARYTDSQLQFVPPQAGWTVAVPRGDWVVDIEKTSADGTGSYHMVTSKTRATPFSIFLDRTKDCTSGESCRARYWQRRGADFQGARDVRMYERNGFHVVQFWIDFGAAAGMTVKQANVSAHMYRDGYWIDLRVSRTDMTVPDPAPLLEVLDSVVVR
jgi:hypothetical protein